MAEDQADLSDLNDARFYEPQLDEQQRALRDIFVQEYLKDYDPLQACLRVGFQFAFAKEFAIRLMQEAYVQKRIAEAQRVSPANETEQQKQDKALTLSVLREAAQRGPYASRVMAAKQLSAIYGWDRPDKEGTAAQELIEAFKNFAQKAPV